MKKVYETKITNRDSCKTYVLRRIGLESIINWLDDTPNINDIISSSKFEHVDSPEIGSILIWIENDYLHKTYQANYISEDGYIFNQNVFNYGHCGIYEGNNIVSECCVLDNKSILRLRKYNDIRKPNFILNYK